MSAARLPKPITAAVCPDVQIKIAATRPERHDAFELVYRAYLRAGLCAENHCGMRYTPFQLLKSTDVIIAKLHGEVISTLSLIRDNEMGLPIEDVYDDEVNARRHAGVHLAEISCLADRRDEGVRFFDLFREMCQLTSQLAWSLGVEELLAAVHPGHTAFYRRYLAFERLGERRDYPSVCGNPAMALSLNFAKAALERPKRWREFFGPPLPEDVLVHSPISIADREYFLRLAEEPAYPPHARIGIGVASEQQSAEELLVGA
jgi:N-acyl amino acid synthase FeeM